MRPLKIIIAVALLLCLLPLPYGYYELVRLGGMVCFAVLAYQSYQQKQEGWTVAYAALAVLFQDRKWRIMLFSNELCFPIVFPIKEKGGVSKYKSTT